jgi:hypothetical protein
MNIIKIFAQVIQLNANKTNIYRSAKPENKFGKFLHTAEKKQRKLCNFLRKHK